MFTIDLPAAEMSAEALFADWLAIRSKDPRDPLTPRSAEPLRYIWTAWSRWLTSPPELAQALAPAAADGGGVDAQTPRAASWALARSEHIAEYLAHGPSPCSGRKPSTAPIQAITRQSYLRVLHDLYEHARMKGLVAQNPAGFIDELPLGENARGGQVFHAYQWKALLSEIPTGPGLWDRRDAAILHLLMDAALTTGEICTLQLTQVGDHFLHPEHVALHLSGTRSAQYREIELGMAASVAMRKWMEPRAGVALRRGDGAPVFLTQKGVPISPRAVFHLVASTVSRAFSLHYIDLPNHIGAQVLRNSRLVMWLNAGMPIDEVVYRAGFKDAKSFRGLRAHIVQSVIPPVKPWARHLDAGAQA